MKISTNLTILLLTIAFLAFSASAQDPVAKFKTAQEATAKGNYSDAIEIYSQLIKAHPTWAGAYHNRGHNYHSIGKLTESYFDFKEAIRLYSDLLAKSPTDVNAYFGRGLLYANLREYALAIKDYERIMALDPKQADPYFYRAEAYERLLKPELGKADRRRYTELGGTLPTPQPRRDFYPEATFDPAAAQAAFGRGNSVVRGIVCTKYEGRVYRAAGVTVSLFPATPYLEEWYRLRDKRAKKDVGIFMSTEATRWRIEVTANEEGRFIFSDMKPGRYYLQAFHNFSSRHAGRSYRGTSTEMINGVLTTTNYYQDYDYNVGHDNRIEKFVDIKLDGDDEKVSLISGGGLFKKISGCL